MWKVTASYIVVAGTLNVYNIILGVLRERYTEHHSLIL